MSTVFYNNSPKCVSCSVWSTSLRSGRAIHFWEHTHHWACSAFDSQLLDIVFHIFLCPCSCVVPLLPPLCRVSPLRVGIVSKALPSPGEALAKQVLREVLLEQSHTEQIVGWGLSVWFDFSVSWGRGGRGRRWKCSSFIIFACNLQKPFRTEGSHPYHSIYWHDTSWL